MEELDAFIDQVKQLPPAPHTLAKLLTVLGDPDIDTSNVVELITHEPALTTNVLRRCNSACFAGSQPVGDVGEAVNRLGFNQIFRIVAVILGAGAFSSSQASYGFGKGELWRHSVAAALAAQNIADERGDNGNLVFTAGLLHDIGKSILSEALATRYASLVEDTEKKQHSLIETEKALLGVNHAEVGGRLLTRWNFPVDLAMSVAFHHNPGEAGDQQRYAAYVYLGNMIAHFMGYTYGHQAFAFRGRAEALDILQVRPETLPQYMIATFERLETVEQLFATR